jgi:imidazole glycerol-phosphate synthase subunit HisH
MSDYIAIIDLNLSNLHNVKLACDKTNIKVKFTSNFKEILNARGLILPGIGSFKEAMKRINKLKIKKAIQEMIHKDKPFLGICLGMQLLFSKGEEFGNTRGLDIFPGKVKKLKFLKTEKQRYSIPHVGWNKLILKEKNKLFGNLNNSEFMYFVHSYYVDTNKKSIISAYTKYGTKTFCSAISYKNIFACQFHPEKSGKEGLKIYRNFKSII